MEIEFQNLKELYNRLEPALTCKVADLKRNGYKNTSKKDVWEFLANCKWISAEDLSLHQMVSDILNSSNEEIYQYKVNNNR